METIVKSFKDVGFLIVIFCGLNNGGINEKNFDLLLKACLHLVAAQQPVHVSESYQSDNTVDTIDVSDGVKVPVIINPIHENDEKNASNHPDNEAVPSVPDPYVPKSEKELSTEKDVTAEDTGLVPPIPEIKECENDVCAITQDVKPIVPEVVKKRWLIVVTQKDCKWCDLLRSRIKTLKLEDRVKYINQGELRWSEYVVKYNICGFPYLIFVQQIGDKYYIIESYTGLIDDQKILENLNVPKITIMKGNS